MCTQDDMVTALLEVQYGQAGACRVAFPSLQEWPLLAKPEFYIDQGNLVLLDICVYITCILYIHIFLCAYVYIRVYIYTHTYVFLSGRWDVARCSMWWDRGVPMEATGREMVNLLT